MAGDEKSKNKWRKLAGIAGSIVSLAVLTYIAIALISGSGLGLARIKELFSKREPVERAGEYYFDVGHDRVFAELTDSLAAAGTLGIQVLDASGAETLKVPFRMSSPAISAQGSRAIVYDIGGTSVRVFNDSGVIASIESNDDIIAASINKSGWFCVCTQEGGGFKGTAKVYNNNGEEAYKVRLASGYLLSAALSPDNKSLAVLNLTDEGSRVTFYNLNSETPDRIYDLPGGLIIDIRYLPGGDLLAVSTEALLAIDKSGDGRELYNYQYGVLRGYTSFYDPITLHLLDYGVWFSGRLVVLNEDGKLLGEIETKREIISMSANSGYLAILQSDGLLFFNTQLEELQPISEPLPAVGATRVLALRDGTVLAAGDNSAVVVRIES